MIERQAHPFRAAIQPIRHPLRTFYIARRIREITDISPDQIVKYSTDQGRSWTQAIVERKGWNGEDDVVSTEETTFVHLSRYMKPIGENRWLVGGIVVRQKHLDSMAVLVRRTTRLTQLLTRHSEYGQSSPYDE